MYTPNLALKLEEFKRLFSLYPFNEAYLYESKTKIHSTQILWAISALLLGVALRKNKSTIPLHLVTPHYGRVTTQFAGYFSWWLFDCAHPSPSQVNEFGRYMTICMQFILDPFDSDIEGEIYDWLSKYILIDVCYKIEGINACKQFLGTLDPEPELFIQWAKFIRYAQHFHLGTGLPDKILERAILEYKSSVDSIVKWVFT